MGNTVTRDKSEDLTKKFTECFLPMPYFFLIINVYLALFDNSLILLYLSLFWFYLIQWISPDCEYVIPNDFYFIVANLYSVMAWTTTMYHFESIVGSGWETLYFWLSFYTWTWLKGLAHAKIIKKSVILFRVLNMTIWCKHVHRLELQIFIIFVLRIHQLD